MAADVIAAEKQDLDDDKSPTDLPYFARSEGPWLNVVNL